MTWESSDTHDLLPAEIDAQLDRLLVEWRTQHQLDDTRAEAIRQAIVESPAALPDEWWQQYVHYLDKVLRQVNRASQDAANRSIEAVSRQWPRLKFAHNDASASNEWRPYLKLV
jgi:hypothetical protein